jgi:hypothetical protein
MNMDNISDIERDMDELRHVFPDPLGLPSNADVFFNHPTAKKLVARGQQSVVLLLHFLENVPDPSLVRPAVLLLSRFAPPTFYPILLGLLQKADQPTTEAFEFGLWLIQVPEAQIARDLVRVVVASGSPHPLLLLQRPVAKVVRPELQSFVKKRQLPLSLYALYCYRYALEQEDIPLLTMVSKWIDVPALSALAGLCLLKLGSKEGLVGIRAGLMSPNEQLRTNTYYELAEYLPKTAITRSGYDPVKPNEAAIDVLMEHLGSVS